MADDWKATCVHVDKDVNYSVSYPADEVVITEDPFTQSLTLEVQGCNTSTKLIFPAGNLKLVFDVERAYELFHKHFSMGGTRSSFEAVFKEPGLIKLAKAECSKTS